MWGGERKKESLLTMARDVWLMLLDAYPDVGAGLTLCTMSLKLYVMVLETPLEDSTGIMVSDDSSHGLE